jgi:hypothetical protein
VGQVEGTTRIFRGRSAGDPGWRCTESKSNGAKMEEGEKVTGIARVCEFSRKNIIL